MHRYLAFLPKYLLQKQDVPNNIPWSGDDKLKIDFNTVPADIKDKCLAVFQSSSLAPGGKLDGVITFDRTNKPHVKALAELMGQGLYQTLIAMPAYQHALKDDLAARSSNKFVAVPFEARFGFLKGPNDVYTFTEIPLESNSTSVNGSSRQNSTSATQQSDVPKTANASTTSASSGGTTMTVVDVNPKKMVRISNRPELGCITRYEGCEVALNWAQPWQALGKHVVENVRRSDGQLENERVVARKEDEARSRRFGLFKANDGITECYYAIGRVFEAKVVNDKVELVLGVVCDGRLCRKVDAAARAKQCQSGGDRNNFKPYTVTGPTALDFLVRLKILKQNSEGRYEADENNTVEQTKASGANLCQTWESYSFLGSGTIAAINALPK